MGDGEKAITCELDFCELYDGCGRKHEGLQFHPRATFNNRYCCNKTSGKRIENRPLYTEPKTDE
ncbi:671_t:CDS:2, partial [Funneliformis geosporum]